MELRPAMATCRSIGISSNSRGRKRVLAEEPGDARRCCYDHVVCSSCGSGDREAQLLLCDACDRGYHSTCLRPILFRVPSGPWICPSCAAASSCARHRSIADFPLVQTKIVDFFRIQRPFQSVEGGKKRRKTTGSSLSLKKKSRKLITFTPSKDPWQRLKQMASLATAMTNSGVEYSDELTYITGLAPRSANDPSLEKGGMQVLSKEDKAAYDRCKEMCRQGACPPLMVSFDFQEGFVVEADSAIKDLTILAEYIGDVDYMSNRERDEGDSIMGLLFTNFPDKDLVICPDRRGNIARFISGINNHSRDGKKKQNLRCVRFNIDGEAHALLIAIRDIRKGERLYYDYNGYQHDYPTEHFV